MSRYNDLTGKKFGKLTVLEFAEKRGNTVYWKCVCDCGKEKTIRSGHLTSGNTKSCGCLQKDAGLHRRGISVNCGENNGMWKGDDVGNKSLHEWGRKHKPKPEFCEMCNIRPPYDLANISGEYKRDINDFKWLCRSCHMKEDGRLERLHAGNTGRYVFQCVICNFRYIGNMESFNKDCTACRNKDTVVLVDNLTVINK